MKLYEAIAQALYSLSTPNPPQYVRDTAEERIVLLQSLLPHGSGFDEGTEISLKAPSPDRSFTLTTSFHHLNPSGYYDGWSTHTITVHASLIGGFYLTVRSAGIPKHAQPFKDYLLEVFDTTLHKEVLK